MRQIPTKEESTPEERWEWFMERYTERMQRALFAEAWRIVGTNEDAEDVMQEAMIRGVTRCWQLRNEDKFFHWMFAIVKHLAYDKQKDKKRALWCSVQIATGMLQGTPSLEDRYLTEETIKKLMREVEFLKSPEKDIFILKSTTNLTLLEISQQLGINYHTTRTKYRRTLAKLSRKLRC